MKSMFMALQVTAARAMCPYFDMGTPATDMAEVPDSQTYDKAVRELNIRDVMDDLEVLMTHSQSCWPADFDHYGPLFIRNAWHCSGTFRTSDGMGGCSGGRSRYEPERSWEDNTNLDKARALLAPVKIKYGDGLSWGDLFVLAGTTAIKQMGGPVSEFCAGRIDAVDGTESLTLGPSPQQERVAPCEVQGKCEQPVGTTTIGLIYVNPEGPAKELEDGAMVQDPDPAKSAIEIRDVFGRMGMNDTETVALIGGGHAFGKCHGACPRSAGFPPKENIDHPWIGHCGTGKGADTVTSGIEGPWTTTPTKWSNKFFTGLREHEWEKHFGPGGKWQWRISGAQGPLADVMRLTTDMALKYDSEYSKIVDKYAADLEVLNRAFDAAWFKLTHRGGRWSREQKCISLADPILV
jgi:catalase (peroxidase I)